MGLTTATERRLTNANFAKELTDHRQRWLEVTQRVYDFAKADLGEVPKPDDVAEHLAISLQSNAEFLKVKSSKHAAAKYWFRDFADLAVFRLWSSLSKAPQKQ